MKHTILKRNLRIEQIKLWNYLQTRRKSSDEFRYISMGNAFRMGDMRPLPLLSLSQGQQKLFYSR